MFTLGYFELENSFPTNFDPTFFSKHTRGMLIAELEVLLGLIPQPSPHFTENDPCFILYCLWSESVTDTESHRMSEL